MRLVLAFISLALAMAFISCSSDKAPDLKPFAIEICAMLRDDSPSRYEVPGDKPSAPRYLVDGEAGAQRFARRSDPSYLVTSQEYSDALDGVCPQTVRRFLGGQSYWDWLTD